MQALIERNIVAPSMIIIYSLRTEYGMGVKQVLKQNTSSRYLTFVIRVLSQLVTMLVSDKW